MEKQIYLLMRRTYRWINSENFIVPSADPVIGVFDNLLRADTHAHVLIAEELEKLPKECEVKTELRHEYGWERFFIMLDNRPFIVYDILQKEVRQ